MGIIHCDIQDGSNGSGIGTSGNPFATIEKCCSVASGLDRIKVSNKGVQPPVESWTGYTNNNLPLVIEAWNNGGSNTIKRPDELLARTSFKIDMQGANIRPFAYDANVPYVEIINGDFYNSTAEAIFDLQGDWTLTGCKISSIGSTGHYQTALLRGNCTMRNCYLIFDKTVGYGLSTNYVNYVYDNFFEFQKTGWAGISLGNNTELPTLFRRNVCYVTGVSNTGTILGTGNNNLSIENNTFITNTLLQTIGILLNTTNHRIKNNIFYGFNHASSDTINQQGNTARRYLEYGRNAYYDSNAPQQPGRGFISVGDDIIGSGSPFTNLAGFDLSVIPALYYGSDDGTDIGAKQHQTAGGGSGSSQLIFR